MPVRLHPDVVATDTDDGTVLLNERTGRYWQLNATGGHVLRQLLDGHEATRIAAEVADRHRIDHQRAELDVAAVIEQLRTAQLVIA
ncbi:lasso peptide biosynthesis PqqD family chaperone [Streptomyces sp. RPA4-5]|uniref:lasso peptide biosynthesis PqqD family chaperone n=1 Tax=Streptomyces TaxID=1883 RepID=UPI00143ECBB0|nr:MULTISPECIES: lasso peptide biosynthesis PqqD family chaperone [Streptomyces]MCX4639694.1 lasso peptide biosynthesis PqqD family chaperone [Streptomyces platensis]QIY56831.1 lasso peptide biosynthesis PqqD family chaperone [Streptomyces sp. RPA4-5]WJY39783.1 lasso peptide biosynthesis PqqD family chaperone [Streptomyces sp. P9-2B-2]